MFWGPSGRPDGRLLAGVGGVWVGVWILSERTPDTTTRSSRRSSQGAVEMCNVLDGAQLWSEAWAHPKWRETGAQLGGRVLPAERSALGSSEVISHRDVRKAWLMAGGPLDR